MAHPYCTIDRLRLLLGHNLTASLLDRNRDGGADAAVYADVQETADAEVDARLRRKYAVPFNGLSDSPTTPRLIQDVSRLLVAAELFARFRPGSDAEEGYRTKADALLNGLLDGTFDIDATEADADEGTHGFAYKSNDPVFAGYDSDDEDNMGNW